MSDYSALEANRLCGLVTIVDDIGDGSIERAKKLLAGIPHGIGKALGSALKRTVKSTEAFAANKIREEYFVKASDFKKYTSSKYRYQTDSNGTTVDLEFRGYHIPLINFNIFVSPNGRVSARVKRSSAKEKLDRVFMQTMPTGHKGLYEREYDERLPIKELFGPSVPQMLRYNEDVEQMIGDHARDAFDKRLKHEVTALLNGWRV